MARKSKRMALNEAIRRGQARMAEGPSSQKDEKAPLCPEVAVRFPAQCRTVFLKSKEKFINGEWLSPKKKLIALLCVALVLGMWLVSLLGTDPSSREEMVVPQSFPVSDGSVVENKLAPFPAEPVRKGLGFSGVDKRDSSESTGQTIPGVAPQLSVVSKGVNVIWIQSIPMSRKGELNSLEVFFRSKGIQTEIIEIADSNYAVLVTQDGFESNPGTEGTEGNKLLERIKRLGAVYVEETEDTKFGVKPFQDALGYKR